ncbi:hypothetical protein ACVWWI_003368 [Bradyrhizobium sp. USDA 3686]|uniref:hypothetical protein n=1 Tax=Bradyrhizobium canariense TaxID=255045 RepID=UPI001FEF0E1A|nr:hypothetical protein [Bradyrhizobium canariense]MBM7483316.1 hypothetical protein [Bradyrhizobium canariense]
MAAFLDACRFLPTAGGTTDWTYSSAVGGYQSPSAAGVVNGRLYKYRAESADLTQWEIGEGAYNTGTGVLARTTVLFNSSGTTSKISFSAAPSVAVVALKEDLISVEEANSFTTTQKQQACTNIGVTTIGQAALGQIPGTTGSTQPGTGFIGERLSSSGSLTFAGSAVSGNICSQLVQPGVWDLEQFATFGGPGGTTSSDWVSAISTTSATVSSGVIAFTCHSRQPGGADISMVHSAPRSRVAISVATTYYLNAQATYVGGGGYSVSGNILATRVS